MPSPHSHKRTVVWQWAHDACATSDDFGTVIKAVRDRMDMPHRFPNKRRMYDYLIGPCRLGHLVEENRGGGVGMTGLVNMLWSSYRAYNERVSHVDGWKQTRALSS